MCVFEVYKDHILCYQSNPFPYTDDDAFPFLWFPFAEDNAILSCLRILNRSCTITSFVPILNIKFVLENSTHKIPANTKSEFIKRITWFWNSFCSYLVWNKRNKSLSSSLRLTLLIYGNWMWREVGRVLWQTTHSLLLLLTEQNNFLSLLTPKNTPLIPIK